MRDTSSALLRCRSLRGATVSPSVGTSVGTSVRCVARSSPCSPDEAAQQRGRVVAVLLHDPSGPFRSPARIARTSAACCRSEWAMLASRTGIASSISCRVDWTEVTASTTRGDPVRVATVRWKRESACRCWAGLRAATTSACAFSSWARAPSSRSAAAAIWAAPGSTIRRKSRASSQSWRRAAGTRAAARPDGVRGFRVTTVPPPRPRVVSTSPACRRAAIASRNVDRETCRRCASSRSGGSIEPRG